MERETRAVVEKHGDAEFGIDKSWEVGETDKIKVPENQERLSSSRIEKDGVFRHNKRSGVGNVR